MAGVIVENVTESIELALKDGSFVNVMELLPSVCTEQVKMFLPPHFDDFSPLSLSLSLSSIYLSASLSLSLFFCFSFFYFFFKKIEVPSLTLISI